MNFSILTPYPPPRVPGNPFGGGGHFFAYCGRCGLIQTEVLNNFFLVRGPPNQWQGPGSKLRVSSPPPKWPPAGEAVFTMACVG